MAKFHPTPRWVLNQLRLAYGPRPWTNHGNPVSILVGTILSQNTSDTNSSAGYRKLWNRFRSWKKVADAPTEEVARCIRISGLSNIKAPRIQTILRQIRSEHGKISLDHLASMSMPDARSYLLSFTGIGPKTANCVLLFSQFHAVFPVDTHIHRIAIRLGWLPPRTSADQAHDSLEPAIAPAERYEMHVLLITHGRQTCKARSPLCHRCRLQPRCPMGQLQRSGKGT